MKYIKNNGVYYKEINLQDLEKEELLDILANTNVIDTLQTASSVYANNKNSYPPIPDTSITNPFTYTSPIPCTIQ